LRRKKKGRRDGMKKKRKQPPAVNPASAAGHFHLFSNQVLHIELFKLQIVVFHVVTLKFTELFPHILSHLRQKVDKM
jgi:hypothetical protein